MTALVVATTQALQEWRCLHCNRLLAFLRLPQGGVISIKCGKCSRLNTLGT